MRDHGDEQMAIGANRLVVIARAQAELGLQRPEQCDHRSRSEFVLLHSQNWRTKRSSPKVRS